ncbi:hypothetical protein BFW38_01775 [Terasakiispira papahanaumokuakeensis]|uniref:rRNA (guanine-N(2)-)-methyltransferase RsmC n=1 Tax=Terasakiispira papahanaumokuakeensis TaxID=197479 RepID=A0A1E2V650_9GAMM|nr:methyltransferase [Terasakiispira papahanaumokuakeensis]ODC02461.1 hypothetical protein BFW38_01775 [Terasakiispira papahanaumokuakeensis]
MLTPPSQLLQRHLAQWREQSLTLVAPPDDEVLTECLRHGLALSVWTSDWRVSRACEQQGIPAWHQLALPSLSGRVVLFWPKAMEEGMAWLNLLTQLQGIELLIVGETRGGIRNAQKKLQDVGAQVAKQDSARRCALLQVKYCPAAPWPALGQQCFNGPDGLTLCSRPGVFSHGRLDEGSECLLSVWQQALQEAIPRLEGVDCLLDVGCGNGVLGAWMKHQHLAHHLTACDVSSFALAATADTLAANGLSDQAAVIGSDIYDGLTAEQTFDRIISNPPFHTGRSTDYALAERMIKEAPQRLNQGGDLWIVANAFLPYREWLTQSFDQVSVMADDGRFRIYYARKT